MWFGLLSRAICDFIDIDARERDLYLMDMLGVETDHHHGYPDDIDADVQARFSLFSRVQLVRSRAPEILESLVNVDDMSFISLNLNDRAADVAALEWAWDRLYPGATVYFDDWGWAYPDLRQRLAEFMSVKSRRLLHFSGGNSILIRGSFSHGKD